MPVGFVAAVGGASLANNMYQSRKNRKAAQGASAQEQDFRNRGLDYQIEQDRLPSQYRNEALTRLDSVYGSTQGQQDLIDQAKNSPLYRNLMADGEDSILRNASATGGLRSGSTNENLANFNAQALLASYQDQIQGIQGLARLPTNANSIAQGYNNMGVSGTQAIMAQRQMSQQSTQDMLNLAGQGVNAYAAYKYSDIRAKSNIRFIKKVRGHKIYKWNWNKAGRFLGLKGSATGVLAHEVYRTHPEAVISKNGVLMVNYEILGLA